MRVVPFLFLMGCGPVTASIIPGGAGDTDTDTDTDTDSDTDTDTDSDTDTDTDTDADPVYGEWEGVREFDFGRCEESVEEFGFLTDIPDAIAACPSCDFVYQLEVSPGRVCGNRVQSPAFRGIELFGESAMVYFIQPTDGGEWVADPRAEAEVEQTRGGILLEYEYAGNVGFEFEVFGEAALIRTE